MQSTPAGRTLDVEDLTVRYGQALAVDGVTLAIEPGEVVALLGPSGCGKTTLLRVIAGFVRQAAGRVRVDGAPIDHLPANQRNIGIVFQNYALFPHMTVAENVAYGLRARGVRGPEVQARISRFLDVVQLGGFRERLPRQLSGGQQQRVALARALAVEPSILLLDEPFAALDRNLRLDMQIEVKRLQRTLGLTTILVTHDQDEAMSVADRIAVMNKGRVEQFDKPVAIYDRPQTLFVNGFIGTTNLLNGKVSAREGGTATVALDAGATLRLPASADFGLGAPVLLSVRPEQLALSSVPGPECWRVEPGLSLPLGAQLVHEARTADGVSLKIVEARRASPPSAGRVYCIRKAIMAIQRMTGERPLGWYCRYGPGVNTRRLVAEEGGFLYDSDYYGDELPFWVTVDGKAQLVIPYSVTNNDGKYAAGIGTSDQWFSFVRDAFDMLYREGVTAPKMMSVGLHMRLIGHPARAVGLERLLDHIQKHAGVWVTRRVDIARHWIKTHPYPGKGLNE